MLLYHRTHFKACQSHTLHAPDTPTIPHPRINFDVKHWHQEDPCHYCRPGPVAVAGEAAVQIDRQIWTRPSRADKLLQFNKIFSDWPSTTFHGLDNGFRGNELIGRWGLWLDGKFPWKSPLETEVGAALSHPLPGGVVHVEQLISLSEGRKNCPLGGRVKGGGY